jgi:prepilin-type N-terminal cleavage/methylation domain-containing protein
LKRKAFTLFELMIVVVIIGVIYALVLSNFNTKKSVHILKISDIKEGLLPFWTKGKQIDFYLYDQCQKSAIFINDTYQEELEPDIKLSEFSNIEVFKPDYRGESQKVEFTPIMIDKKLQKVCFHYTLYPNGSNSSFILKKQKLYYIFYPYFQDVNKTQDLSEAMDLLQQKPFRGVMPDEVND